MEAEARRWVSIYTDWYRLCWGSRCPGSLTSGYTFISNLCDPHKLAPRSGVAPAIEEQLWFLNFSELLLVFLMRSALLGANSSQTHPSAECATPRGKGSHALSALGITAGCVSGSPGGLFLRTHRCCLLIPCECERFGWITALVEPPPWRLQEPQPWNRCPGEQKGGRDTQGCGNWAPELTEAGQEVSQRKETTAIRVTRGVETTVQKITWFLCNSHKSGNITSWWADATLPPQAQTPADAVTGGSSESLEPLSDLLGSWSPSFTLLRKITDKHLRCQMKIWVTCTLYVPKGSKF